MSHPLDRKIVPNNTEIERRLSNHRIAVQIYNTVKFNCKFENSKCAGVKNDSWRNCCCTNCADQCGYLEFIPEKNESEYKAVWTDEQGFYDSKCGCKLPVALRSSICLSYVCHSCKVTRKDSKLLNIIRTTQSH